MVDGIYPDELSRFVEANEKPFDRRALDFAKWLEAPRKILSVHLVSDNETFTSSYARYIARCFLVK